jgi:hypothetical protein
VTRRNETVIVADQLGVERVQEIEWTHPQLRTLSDAARLIYACLVDGRSATARETLESVELVWKNRHRARERYATAREVRDALDEICIAVEELVSAGLLVLLDRSSIHNGWVMRPWESEPN